MLENGSLFYSLIPDIFSWNLFQQVSQHCVNSHFQGVRTVRFCVTFGLKYSLEKAYVLGLLKAKRVSPFCTSSTGLI